METETPFPSIATNFSVPSLRLSEKIRAAIPQRSLQTSFGGLPILFTSIGRWWGTDSATRQEVKIDLVAKDGKDYLFCECKWKNEQVDISVLDQLKAKADAFSKKKGKLYFVLFSKSGFTDAVIKQAQDNDTVKLVSLEMILQEK